MQKINAFLTPILVLVLLGFIIHDKFVATKPEPSTTHDAIAVKLGKEYRLAIDKAAVLPLSKISTSSYVDMNTLITAQRIELDADLTNAYRPIATELEKRFGKAEDGKAAMADVQLFFRDLAYGYSSK